MKCVAVLISSLAVVGAFAPLQAGRSNTQLSESLFDKVCECGFTVFILDHDGFSPFLFLYSLFQIFNMDLFNPVKEQNNYGARSKKNVSQQLQAICALPIFSFILNEPRLTPDPSLLLFDPHSSRSDPSEPTHTFPTVLPVPSTLRSVRPKPRRRTTITRGTFPRLESLKITLTSTSSVEPTLRKDGRRASP